MVSTIYFPDGNKYQGEFENNKRHGKGVMYYTNGRIESQTWQNGFIMH